MNTYSLLHSTDGDKNEANPKALLKMNRTGQSHARGLLLLVSSFGWPTYPWDRSIFTSLITTAAQHSTHQPPVCPRCVQFLIRGKVVDRGH